MRQHNAGMYGLKGLDWLRVPTNSFDHLTNEHRTATPIPIAGSAATLRGQRQTLIILGLMWDLLESIVLASFIIDGDRKGFLFAQAPCPAITISLCVSPIPRKVWIFL